MNRLVKKGIQLLFHLAAIIMVAMTSTTFVDARALSPQNHISYTPTNRSTCHLNSPQGNVQHVIYIQFDNVHFTRDNPNVPSDLEQMPHLLNFIKNNGTMLTNHHTGLIAHTSPGLLNAMTGVYGARHGIPLYNSYRYFKPDGTTGLAQSFAYWTSPVNDSHTSPPTDTAYNMISAPNTNTPAPWVPYTRAGCNVGGVDMVNTVLENTSYDVPAIYGPNSPQAQEALTNPKQAMADYVGIAVHCASGDVLCSSANNGLPDMLPNEPGGYAGYSALYGHKYVAPQISPNGPLTNLDGNVIQDSQGNAGFPGFDLRPTDSLAYVAAMQEHNVPVTYAFIADAHDASSSGPAYGPGEAAYVAQLKAYDDAFGKFFTRLANDGITSRNTLFVITADEGDHFVGGPPSPANCDGINIPCTYSPFGELNTNLTGLLATRQGVTTPFTVLADAAPSIYITGNPARTDPVTRTFSQASATLHVTNLFTGANEKLINYMADPVELNLLHMVTADPARTPTLVQFANPNYYVETGDPNCNSPCVSIAMNSQYAWNHGTVSPDINTTWLGIVGPGVQKLGIDNSIWSDHTDTRPTMMALLGLKDDYIHDGRVLFEILRPHALPWLVRHNLSCYIQLAQKYKQLNAPLGQFGQATLQISTIALSSNDATYTRLENLLQSIGTQRDSITNSMIAQLEYAEFGWGTNSYNKVQITRLIKLAEVQINRVKSLLRKQ
ncbi:hypothetical protein ccbrp13_63560 [Ktedonobacteria bacterium brp13]|nr:hypothetical protein ccbrp13_63560 [Ktedonobacteria bacterium brp13]